MSEPNNITVRDFSDLKQMEGDKTYTDLPIVFTGTMCECHVYCSIERKYKWQKSNNVFGGYYVNEVGSCLMIV
jgi:hypothetical protein